MVHVIASMRVQDTSSVKFYNLSAGSNKSLPTWLSPEQRAKLIRDERFSEQLVLLQDFDMPEASQRMKISSDRRYLFMNGVYKPSCKIFEVSELSMKCERFFDEETVDFELLTSDYAKVCYLGVNGSLFFHAKYGQYYTTRLPMIGRCIKYDKATCDLYAVGSTSSIQRLNLEAGRFTEPIVTEFDAINVMGINPVHSLLAFGGDDGYFECRDPRSPSSDPIARVSVGECLFNAGEINNDQIHCDVSALEFHNNGLHFGVGTSTGHALLFDLRSPTPLFIKDHRNELPIHSVRFQNEKFISADMKVIKIFDEKTGTSFANLETDAPSTDVILWPESGLLLVAGERPQAMAYYCPSIGPAPRWCSFLDNITEELEDRRSLASDEIYENYKFLTREDLSSIGGDSLIGTKYLRRYMHGFFITTKLYKQMKSASTPWYDEFQRAKEQRVLAERESRITLDESLVKQKPAAKKKTEKEDNRFAKIEEDPNFALEEKFVEIEEKKKSKKKAREGVKVYEVREEEEEEDHGTVLFTNPKKSSRSSKKLGERVQDMDDEAKGKKRSKTNISSVKHSFVPQSVLDERLRKKVEKQQRIEKNKTRRKASARLLK